MDALGERMPKLSTKSRRCLAAAGYAIAILGVGLIVIATGIIALAIAPLIVPLMLLSQYLRSFVKEELP